jgi:hypothetical protein
MFGSAAVSASPETVTLVGSVAGPRIMWSHIEAQQVDGLYE